MIYAHLILTMTPKKHSKNSSSVCSSPWSHALSKPNKIQSVIRRGLGSGVKSRNPGLHKKADKETTADENITNFTVVVSWTALRERKNHLKEVVKQKRSNYSFKELTKLTKNTLLKSNSENCFGKYKTMVPFFFRRVGRLRICKVESWA